MTARDAQRMAHNQPSALWEFLALGADRSIISIAVGYADAALLLTDKLDTNFHKMIRVPATALMRDVALAQARLSYVPEATFFPLTPRLNNARINVSSSSKPISALGL